MPSKEITLPVGSRQIGGLLAAARPLESIEQRWWGGVVFSGRGCAAPSYATPCDADTGEPDERTPVGPSGPWSFMHTDVMQGTTCSTFSMSEGARMSRERLDETREKAVGHVLQTGAHTDHDASNYENPDPTRNPALADATQITAVPLPPVDALACLEQHAANNLHTNVVFVHASPLVATHLHAADLLWRDGQRWRTATGAVVIISPGYTGAELYVTHEVWTATGRLEETQDVDRPLNDQTAWAVEAGIAVFDACWMGRVTVDVALCEEAT